MKKLMLTSLIINIFFLQEAWSACRELSKEYTATPPIYASVRDIQSRCLTSCNTAQYGNKKQTQVEDCGGGYVRCVCGPT